MIKEVKKVRKWRGVVGCAVLVAVCLVGVMREEAFGAPLEFTGGAVGTGICDGSASAYCFNGKAWQFYKFKDGASGDTVIGTNYHNFGGYDSDGDAVGSFAGDNAKGTDPISIDGCKSIGAEGIWVLQHLTSQVPGPEYERYAFGALGFGDQSINADGSRETIDYYSDTLNTYGNTSLEESFMRKEYRTGNALGWVWSANGTHGYDTSKLEWVGALDVSGGNSEVEKEVKKLYESYNGTWGSDTDHADMAAFCGSMAVDEEEKEAKYKGYINLSSTDLTKISGEEIGEGDKVVEYVGPGKPLTNAISGTPIVKRTDSEAVLDGVASTVTKGPEMKAGTSSLGTVGPFIDSDIKFDGGTSRSINVGGKWNATAPTIYPNEIPVSSTPYIVCFNMAFLSSAKYKGSGSSWTRDDSSLTNSRANACAKIINYRSQLASFSGESNGKWSENLGKVPAMTRDASGTSAELTTEEVDTVTGEVKDFWLDDSGSEISTNYSYSFEHNVILDKPQSSALYDFFNGRGYTGASGEDDIKVGFEYVITEKKITSSGEFEDVVKSDSGDFGLGNGLFDDQKYVKTINVEGDVPLNKSNAESLQICQKIDVTETIRFETTEDGVSRSLSGLKEGAWKCINLGVPVSEDTSEDLDGGYIEAHGDTEKNLSNLFENGFHSSFDSNSKKFRILGLNMTGKFGHQMVLDSSGLRFDDLSGYTDASGDRYPLNGAGIRSQEFRSDYVALGRYDGVGDVYIHPKDGDGNSLHGVSGFGLDMALDGVISKFKVLETYEGGGTGGGYNADNPWSASRGSSGSSELKIGVNSSGVVVNMELLAGETKGLEVLTVNAPWRWNVKYKKWIHTTSYPSAGGGSMHSPVSVPLKITFDGVEKDESGGAEFKSDNLKDLVVHRDYNFKVENFKVDLGSWLPGNDFKVVVPGQDVKVPFMFDVGSHLDDNAEWGDGKKREFLTDVFENNTKAYLVGFEVKPGIGGTFRDDLQTFLNGFSYYGEGEGEDNGVGDISDVVGFIKSQSFVRSDLVYYAEVDPFSEANKGGSSVNLRENKVYSVSALSDHKGLSYVVDAKISASAAVGGKYCFGIFVKNPTNDESTGEDVANGSSLLSEIACANVVKKPSFEVWGGDVATEGGIRTSLTKTTVGGADGTGGTFGSWGDFGLIAAEEEIKNMSSGRALKLAGVGVQMNMNRFSPITIANRGDYGKARVSGLGNSIYEDLISRYRCSGGSSSCEMSNGTKVRMLVDGVEISMNTFDPGDKDGDELKGRYVLIVDGKARVSGDIKLKNSGYGDFESGPKIPQVLILAEGKITVDDTVEQIDAWLISKSQVDTCYAGGRDLRIGNSGDTDNIELLGLGKCKKKLMINGPIIGNNLVFERTDGEAVNGYYYDESGNFTDSGTGDSLGVSAEIIDFSPSAILFGAKESSDAAPRITYIRKLAPRF